MNGQALPPRIAFGRGVGVSSGILGVLCVFAVLCFRFPHHLVLNDGRPFYVAHLGLLRGLLLVCLIATLVLGLAGVLLARSKHGVAGLVLGAIGRSRGTECRSS